MSLTTHRHLPVIHTTRREAMVLSVEFIVTCAALVGYFVARGMRPPDIDESVQRSLRIIEIEQHLGIFQEQAWQAAFVSNDVAMYVANLVYAWGHFPVLAAIGIWLLLTDLKRFRFTRNVMLLSGVLGLVCYWALPAAPPRLMEFHGYDFGFIDTVHGATSQAYYFQPGPLVNDYAALPSFHFGWIALASIAIWVNTTRRPLRLIAIVLSVLMFWSVTVTANHYFFDMAFGGVLVGVAWLVMLWLYSEPVARRLASARNRLLHPSSQAAERAAA